MLILDEKKQYKGATISIATSAIQTPIRFISRANLVIFRDK